MVNEWKREKHVIRVSTRADKKYDVYENGKYKLSFGYLPMEHYRDKLGYFAALDHNDKGRRRGFKSRFSALIAEKNKDSPIYWSNKYLW